MQQERADREHQIKIALGHHKVSADEGFWGRMPYHIQTVMKRFVDEGHGQAEWIADAAVAASRHKELTSAFRTLHLKEPRVDIESNQLFRYDTPRFADAFRMKNSKCDARIENFLLRSSEDSLLCTAAELAADLDAERSSRKCHIDTTAARLGIDIGAVDRNYDINKFIEENSGDGESILAQILLDERWTRSKLPDQREFIRKQQSIEKRLTNGKQGGLASIDALIQDLLLEERNRRQELIAAISDTLKNSKQGNALTPLFRLEDIQRRDFVRFGVGTAADSATEYIRSLRLRSLQLAVDGARPCLLSSSQQRQKDPRNEQFLTEQGPWASAHELLTMWQDEQRNRVSVIRDLLWNEQDLVVEDEELYVHLKHSTFVCEDIGSAADAAFDVGKRIRQRRLEDKLRTAGLSHQIYSPQDPRCKSFIEGSSRLANAEEIALLMMTEKKARDEATAQVPAKLSTSPMYSHWQYDLRTAVRHYTETGEGSLAWIESAVAYFQGYDAIKESFGGLGGMLPTARYADACEWKDAYIERLSQITSDVLGIPEKSNCGIITLIMQYVEPPFSEAVYEVGRPDECSDQRLVQLLVSHRDCPWKNGREAAGAIRVERTSRMNQIDELFPEHGNVSPSVLCILSRAAPTKEDKEDAIWNEDGLRADYINGKISLDEAIRDLTRVARENMLENALKGASLHVKLMTHDERCKDFLGSPELAGSAESSLTALIRSLQQERSDRLDLLQAAFEQHGEHDVGIGIGDIDGLDDDYDDIGPYYSRGYDNIFLCSSQVGKTRFEYIDLGQGTSEMVVRASLRCQRSEILYKVLERQFSHWLPDELEDWMHASKECRAFVATTDAGFPTKEEMTEFVSMVDQLPAEKLQRVPASDEDQGCGNEWKYHLSGGDYGNDPDTDAMWNSYWDC